jgi:hypothetical protein
MCHIYSPGCLLVNQRLAVFADAYSLTVLALNAYPGGFVALRANQHHVRNMDRTFELDDPWRKRPPTLGLYLALVFFAHINTLDNHTTLIWQYLDHFASLAFIFEATTDDFNRIAFFNFYLHCFRSCIRQL